MQSPEQLLSDKQSHFDLPKALHLRYWRWPKEDEGVCVEFRLIYKGPLGSQRGGGRSGSIVTQKHSIRRQVHRQLRELWYTHPFLQRFTLVMMNEVKGQYIRIQGFDWIAQDYKKFGYRFLPLVSSQVGLACSLDILFLRRDAPGNLITTGGDIDNRIKVLLDGLRVPQYNNEVDGISPEDGEDPFFCLLEDDKLITEIKVTTDRLLIPQDTEEHLHDVHLVIHVTTKLIDPSKAGHLEPIS